MGGFPPFNRDWGWAGFAIFGIPPMVAGAFFTAINAVGISDTIEKKYGAKAEEIFRSSVGKQNAEILSTAMALSGTYNTVKGLSQAANIGKSVYKAGSVGLRVWRGASR